MPASLTYSPVPHAPTTARTQLAPTRRYARYAEIHPSPPLQGLRGTRAATVSYRASVPAGHGSHGVAPSYRALAPHGAGLASGIEGHRSDAARPTANYSLLTANSSYTFSAKEKDSETGLSYFGSRYYSSDLSIWLSVDPMSDKYPSLSPFTYCADNPVKLVDPDGEEFIGAVMGVLIGATTEIISQTIANGMNNLFEGENFFKGWGSKIDWVDVGVSAAVGALDGMAPGWVER